MASSFKAFRQFNNPSLHPLAGERTQLSTRFDEHFSPARHMDRLALALSARRALPVKELLESAEFYMRVRRRVRAQTVVDLCAGHGLVGLLFAAFERSVSQVILIDQRQPESFARILEAVIEIAPWSEDKVRYVESTLLEAEAYIPPGAGVVGVHACGVRTDRCLELASARGCAVAVMPCCYAQTARRAPRALRSALGAILTTDIDRTYRMERAGYEVDWSSIPAAITPMNRILLGIMPSEIAPHRGQRRPCSPGSPPLSPSSSPAAPPMPQAIGKEAAG